MKVLKKEKTIEEIVGYEASDGKIFKNEQACKDYEDSAEFVIEQDFYKVCVGGKVKYENEIFTDYGYGSEEYAYAIVDIKDVNVLEIVNRYLKLKNINLVSPEYVGKKIMIDIGGLYVGYAKETYAKTLDDLVKNFISDMGNVFEESYTLDQIERQTIEYKLKNGIEFYEKDCYTADDLYRLIKEIYEIVK